MDNNEERYFEILIIHEYIYYCKKKAKLVYDINIVYEVAFNKERVFPKIKYYMI